MDKHFNLASMDLGIVMDIGNYFTRISHIKWWIRQLYQ